MVEIPSFEEIIQMQDDAYEQLVRSCASVSEVFKLLEHRTSSALSVIASAPYAQALDHVSPKHCEDCAETAHHLEKLIDIQEYVIEKLLEVKLRAYEDRE